MPLEQERNGNNVGQRFLLTKGSRKFFHHVTSDLDNFVASFCRLSMCRCMSICMCAHVDEEFFPSLSKRVYPVLRRSSDVSQLSLLCDEELGVFRHAVN